MDVGRHLGIGPRRSARLTIATALALCVLAAAWLASGTDAQAVDLGAGASCEPEVSADLVAVACTLDTGEGSSSVPLEALRQMAGASTSVPVWVQAWGGGGRQGDRENFPWIGSAGSGGSQGYAQVYFDSFGGLTETVGEELHYYVGQGANTQHADDGAGGSSTIVSTADLSTNVACIHAASKAGERSTSNGGACSAAKSNIVLLAGGGGGGGATQGSNSAGNGGGGGIAVSGSEPAFADGSDGQSHSGRRGLGGEAEAATGGGTEGSNGPEKGGSGIGGEGGYPSVFENEARPGYLNATPYGSTEYGLGGNGSVNTHVLSALEYTGEGGSGGGGLGGGGSSGYGTDPYGPGGGGAGGGSFAMAGDEPPETGPDSSVAADDDGKVRVTFGYSLDCSTSSDSSATGIRATCVLPPDYDSVDVNFLASTLGAQTSSDIWLQAWGGYGGPGTQTNGGPSEGGKGGYAQTQFDDVAAMKGRFGTAVLHYYLGAAGTTITQEKHIGEGEGGSSTAVALAGLSEEDPPCVVAGETIVSDGGKCTEEADSNMILVAGGGGGGAGQPDISTHADGGAGGSAVAGAAAAFAGGRPGAWTTETEPGLGGEPPATGGGGGYGTDHHNEAGASGIGGEGGEGNGYLGQPLPLADTYGHGGRQWAGGGGGMGGGGGGGASTCSGGVAHCTKPSARGVAETHAEASAAVGEGYEYTYVYGAAGGGGSFAAAGEEIHDETAPSNTQPGEDGAFAVSIDGVSKKISAVGTPLKVSPGRDRTIDGLSVRIRCPRLCVARTSGKVIGRSSGPHGRRFAIPLVRHAATVLSGRRGEVQLQVAREGRLRRLLRQGAWRPSARIRVRVYDRRGRKLGGRLVRVERVRLDHAKRGHRHHGKHVHRH